MLGYTITPAGPVRRAERRGVRLLLPRALRIHRNRRLGRRAAGEVGNNGVFLCERKSSCLLDHAAYIERGANTVGREFFQHAASSGARHAGVVTGCAMLFEQCLAVRGGLTLSVSSDHD